MATIGYSRSFSLSLALMFAAASCGGASESEIDELVFEDDDAALKDDGVVRPFGTFRRDPGPAKGFMLLTLKTDRTHHYSQELANCTPGACTDELSGKYRFAKSHGKTYVVLYNDGDWWYSFEYKFEGDALQLRHAGRGGSSFWFTLRRTPDAAWCATPTDCKLQNLLPPTGRPAAWRCQDNVCQS